MIRTPRFSCPKAICTPARGSINWLAITLLTVITLHICVVRLRVEDRKTGPTWLRYRTRVNSAWQPSDDRFRWLEHLIMPDSQNVTVLGGSKCPDRVGAGEFILGRLSAFYLGGRVNLVDD